MKSFDGGGPEGLRLAHADQLRAAFLSGSEGPPEALKTRPGGQRETTSSARSGPVRAFS